MEQCYQVRVEGVIPKPFYAESFEQAAEEFIQMAEDMLVAADKKQQECWATPLRNQTFSAKVTRVDDDQSREMELTLIPRTEDMPPGEVPGAG